MDLGVGDALAAATSVLEDLGASLEEVSLPTTPYIAHIRRIGEEKLDALGQKRYPARRWVVERTLACYYIIAPSECSANLARYDGVKYGFSYRETDNLWEALEKTPP